MNRDPETERLLGKIDPGDDDPDFLPELWRRAHLADEVAIRRWKHVAGATAALALLAASTAAALAAHPLRSPANPKTQQPLLCVLAESSIPSTNSTKDKPVRVSARLIIKARQTGGLVRTVLPKTLTSTCRTTPEP